MSIHVICNYFSSGNVARQQEYDFCLTQNARNPYVAACHVFVETKDEDILGILIAQFDSEIGNKIRPVPIGGQMLYSDAFAYANSTLPGEITVIQNSDIYVENHAILATVVDKWKSETVRNVVFALTRHEHDKCNHTRPLCNCPFMQKKYIGSHDSFWFVSPVPDSVIAQVQHKQNVWGAENKVVVALEAAGLLVKNPSRDVRVYHVHASRYRPWLVPYRASTALATAALHSELMQTTLD